MALLLRYSNSEIVLFEASKNHGNGVSLLKWSDFKRNNYHSLYEKIVFRKLITPRNFEFVKILEEFCGNTLGSKSLVSLKTKIKPTSDSAQDEFYSSELVAATYKLLGLINDSLPSNKYQIDQFSTRGSTPAKLKVNTSLGEEKVIIFIPENNLPGQKREIKRGIITKLFNKF